MTRQFATHYVRSRVGEVLKPCRGIGCYWCREGFEVRLLTADRAKFKKWYPGMSEAQLDKLFPPATGGAV